MKNYSKMAEKIGGMSPDEARQGRDFGTAIAYVSDSLARMGQIIASQVAPVFTPLLAQLGD